MIILPDRFIYLCTPRSGSRTIRAVLSQQPGAIGSEYHHAPIDEVKEAIEKYQVKTITLMRDPAHILLSYWWPRTEGKEPRRPFEQRIRAGKTKVKRGRLYPYHEVTDEYYLFELGMEQFFKDIGIQVGEIPTHGMNNNIDRTYADSYRALVKGCFPEDVELYQLERKNHGLTGGYI